MPHLLHYHLLSHRLHYTEINAVYISIAASSFGMSLVGIFIPIYLYTLGYGLAMIALFFIMSNVVRLLMTPLAGLLLARYGAKFVFALSQLVALLFICLLAAADAGFGMLVIGALAFGVNTAMFWLAYHFSFSAIRTRHKASRQVSISFILLGLAHALGPLLGGILATQIGMQYVFILTAIFLVVAAYAMTRTSGHIPAQSFRLSQLGGTWKHMRRDTVANFGNASQAEITLQAWPLFLFLFLATYESVGFLASLALVISVAAMFIVGRRGDQGKNRQQLRIGSKSMAFVHAARPFAQTFGMATGVNMAHEIFSNLYRIPFATYYYEHASRAKSRLLYVVNMEMAASAGFTVSWLIILALALILPVKAALITIFVYAAVMILLVTNIVPRALSAQPSNHEAALD